MEPKRAELEPDRPDLPEAMERWRLGRHEIAAIFGFWTLVAVLTTANRLLDAYGPSRATSGIQETIYWLFSSYLWAAVTPLVFWLAWRFGVDRAERLRGALTLLLAGLAIVTAMTLARDVVWTDVLHLPQFGGEKRSLWRMIARPWFLNDLVTYAGVLAAGIAREYFVRDSVRQREAARLHAHTAQLQAQLAGARLEALRMQLNPHFLFNTLHAISTLVERDPRGVRRMIARLSELLRYTLNGAGEQEVSVERELHFLHQYLEIMQVRFQGRLEIDMRAEPGVNDALVPTLILQPLVENAVKHGVSNLLEAGRIEVRVGRRGDRLLLEVRDNGPGPEATAGAAEAGGGVGLRNVRERLRELYGADHDLTLTPAEGGGALASIELPFRTGGMAPPVGSTSASDGRHGF